MLKRLSSVEFLRVGVWVVSAGVVSLASLTGVDKLYYWRDDWVFLWSNKNNPPLLYAEIGGSAWWIKSGLFHPLYARLYGRVPIDRLQFSGVVLKTVNSMIIYLVVYSLVRKKTPAILAMLLFAAYGGAQEVYTWHRITAVATGFALLAFAFHNLFLTSSQKIYLLGTLVAASLALFSYFGRVVGIFPVFIFSTALAVYERVDRRHLAYALFLVVLFGGLFVFTRTSIHSAAGAVVTKTIANEISDPKNIAVFLSNVGNLAQSSFVKLSETGGLMGAIFPWSLIVGQAVLGLWLVSLLVFAINRAGFFKLMTVSLAWLWLTYFPNWIYAGGGPGTMIGSAHRYFGVSAAFFPLVAGVIFSRLSRVGQIGLFMILVVLSLNYSGYLMDKEKYLRSSAKVAKVYSEIVNRTKNDPLPRLIIIDSQLDYLVTGWFPYAYGYYKEITDRQDFPSVFARWDAGIEWLCASPADRDTLEAVNGVSSYQRNRPVMAQNIYAFSFTPDGQFTDLTSDLRKQFSQCH